MKDVCDNNLIDDQQLKDAPNDVDLDVIQNSTDNDMVDSNDN